MRKEDDIIIHFHLSTELNIKGGSSSSDREFSYFQQAFLF